MKWIFLSIAIIAEVIGYFFYKQTPDLPAIIGILLIMAGVIVINLFSKSITQ